MIIANRQQKHTSWKTALFYLVIIATTLFFLFPIIWMVMASFKTQVDNLATPPVVIFTPTLENYRETFVRNPFPDYTWNSFLVAAASTAVGVLVGAPAAFSIARFKQRGLSLVILTARIMPAISYLLPWYILFLRLKMIGTYESLILTHLTVGLPIITWMLVGAFEEVPYELEDSTLVDGGSIYTVFLRVALPLTAPTIAAASIIAFIFSWNNFLFSIILAGAATRPLPVAVFNFVSYLNINVGGLAAAATVITGIPMLLALLAQRYIVSGLTMGAVKG